MRDVACVALAGVGVLWDPLTELNEGLNKLNYSLQYINKSEEWLVRTYGDKKKDEYSARRETIMQMIKQYREAIEKLTHAST